MTRRTSPLLAALSLLLPAAALAHVTASGNPTANTHQEISFNVPHGCGTVDTFSVRIQLPASVSGVRPMRSDFGKATLEKDMAGNVTAVTWTKPDAELLDSDYGMYKLVVRMKLPDAPFTQLHFPTVQTCKDPMGVTSTSEWTVTDGSTTDKPAPSLKLVPARKPGWNRFTVPVALPKLSDYFSDALIVWKGTAAYSSNPVTTELIGGTEGVTPLTELSANDEVWVRY